MSEKNLHTPLFTDNPNSDYIFELRVVIPLESVLATIDPIVTYVTHAVRRWKHPRLPSYHSCRSHRTAALREYSGSCLRTPTPCRYKHLYIE